MMLANNNNVARPVDASQYPPNAYDAGQYNAQPQYMHSEQPVMYPRKKVFEIFVFFKHIFFNSKHENFNSVQISFIINLIL